MIRTLVSGILLSSLVVATEPVYVLSSDENGLVLQVVSSRVDLAETEAAGRRFIAAGIDGAGLTDGLGQPAVPLYRRLIEIPYGARLSVGVELGAAEDIALSLPLLPRQAPVSKSGETPQFAFDPAAYAKPGFAPEPGATVTEIGEMRGHRLALVEIRPVGYDPVAGIMRWYQSMRVSLRWSSADLGRTRALHQRYDSPLFCGRLDRIVLNAGQFSLDGPPTLPLGYLIIVPDAWRTNIQPLAEWRRRKGWHVFVRTLSEVGGGQANTVKNYIQYAYDNWPIPPSIVMLVGDVDQIGYFTGQGSGSPPTDLNFSLLAGSDWLPDIDLCRASVASAAQLDSLVMKTLRYEQCIGAGGTDYLQRAYFIASSDGGNHQIAEATHQYCMRKLRQLGVVCDSIWLYYNQGTPIAVAVNNGRSWVTYSGHGNTNCWADPSPAFDLAAVHALTNVDMVPWVQTYACLSGDYTSTSYPECFSEAWIRNGRRGALAHMASTVTSYWTEDDTLQRRVFDYMFDSLYSLPVSGMNRAKLKYLEQMGNNSTTRRYFEMYNIVGDGAVDVYWQVPAQLTVNHPPVIPLGSYPLNVAVQRQGQPVAGALVCAMAKQDTTVFASAYTDVAGQVTLPITTRSPDSILITVTGHNVVPYLGLCLALPASGPYVMLLRSTVDDSAGGNNDGIINPGETVNLPSWFKNWGSSPAQTVRALLRCTDPAVTLIDTLKLLGTIGAGDSVWTGARGFGFRVANSCTNGYNLRFSVVVRDANDSIWVSALNLIVGAPVLEFVTSVVADPPPGGNGNGMLEPGETGDLMLVLRNVGRGHAYAVSAFIRSGDGRLTVIDSTGYYPLIMRDSTAINTADRFRLRADSSIPRETQIPCTLALDVGGARYVRVFNLGIGVIRTCDPIPDGPRQPPLYYAYDESDTLYVAHPDFNWVEVRDRGTRLSLSDDQTITISLPTAFGPWVYYGQSYSEISICSNGWVAPGRTQLTTYNNTSLPNSSMPPMVCVNWDDLYPPAGGGVWYYFDEPNHRFIVEYDSVRYYSGTNYDKNQVIIYDTTLSGGQNHILLQYLTANQTGSATIGIQDPTATIAIEALFNGTYHRGCAPIVPGRAIRVAPIPPAVGLAEAAGPVSPALCAGFVRCAPNPVRGSATIIYALASELELKLAVFDAAGRQIRELHRGLQKPGLHTVVWDGRDGKGSRVGQGVYFYRLEADGLRSVQKTVVLD